MSSPCGMSEAMNDFFTENISKIRRDFKHHQIHPMVNFDHMLEGKDLTHYEWCPVHFEHTPRGGSIRQGIMSVEVLN